MLKALRGSCWSEGVRVDLFMCEGSPLGQRPPGTVLVGEDVDDFLL